MAEFHGRGGRDDKGGAYRRTNNSGGSPRGYRSRDDRSGSERGGQGYRPRQDRPDFEERPRREYGDRPRQEGRENREGQGRGGDRGYGSRGPRRDFDERPRREYGDRPRRDEGGFRSGRDDRRDDRGSDSRGPRRDFDERPRRDYGDRPRQEGRDDRRDDRGQGYRPRGEFREGQGRREGGRDDRGSDSRGPRRDFQDRPRRDYGDRPRRDEGASGARRDDRGYDSRGPRRDFDERPRRDYGDRPRRDEGGFRPGRDDRRDDRGQGYRPRGEFREGQGRREGGRDDRGSDSRGPRRDFQDRPRRDYGDRPRRDEGGFRPGRDDRRDDRGQGYRPRGEFREGQGRREGGRDDRGSDSRGPRRDFQDRPRRDYGDRPAYRGTGPEEGEWTERPHSPRDLRSSNRADRPKSPDIDEDVTGAELDRVVRAQLKTLESKNAEWVSKHLVMAARLMDTDPELAFQHALAASRRGGRMAPVREAVGLTAYAAGHYGEALREFRTFRRISGSNEHLPLMADCERGLGRPDRALELARSEDTETLDTAGKVELAMVVSGARADLGELEAAVAALEIPQLDMNRAFSFSPRLFRAYADALEAVDRAEEAAQWRRQALVAESALGTGDFAEPDIIDLVGDEDDKSERPRRQPDEQGARDEQADPDDQEGLEVPAGTEEAPVQESSADQDVAGAGDPAAAPAADKQASDGND